jgi:hypothetical protein
MFPVARDNARAGVFGGPEGRLEVRHIVAQKTAFGKPRKVIKVL